MDHLEEEENLIRRYLLGELDEDACKRLDEKMFTSPEFKSQMLLVEDELTEDYLFGLLSGSEREAFKRRIERGGDQTSRYKLIRALQSYTSRQPQTQTKGRRARRKSLRGGKLLSFFMALTRPSLIVAGFLLVVGLALWIMRGSLLTLHRSTPNQALEQEVLRLNPPEGRPLPPELEGQKSHILSVVLTPYVLRGIGDKVVVKVLEGTSVLQFELKLPLERYDAYRVTLHSSDGRELLRHDGLTHRSTWNSDELIFNLPASGLTQGDYQLRLSGQRAGELYQEGPYYSFRIEQGGAG
jgi:hypothetical protein